mgnify:CR=1 FL=1
MSTYKKKILITGASGFLGKSLLAEHTKISSYAIHSTTRDAALADEQSVFFISNIGKDTEWANSLADVDVVIHCAARAHVMNDGSVDPLTEYRKVNVAGTLNLARQAAEAGVKRFIFISSVKVNGESTTNRKAYSEDDLPQPEDAYGISKKEAEDGLQEIAKNTGMELVIIRPPLVYGAGVKANFLNLLKLSAKNIPLPFARVNNKRSMVYVGNLVDFIICCVEHPAAANQTFLIADDAPVSLAGLLKQMRTSLGLPVRLLPVPVAAFKVLGKVTGKQAVVDRLVGDLALNTQKAKMLLGWEAPYSFEQGIQITVEDFLSRKEA